MQVGIPAGVARRKHSDALGARGRSRVPAGRLAISGPSGPHNNHNNANNHNYIRSTCGLVLLSASMSQRDWAAPTSSPRRARASSARRRGALARTAAASCHFQVERAATTPPGGPRGGLQAAQGRSFRKYLVFASLVQLRGKLRGKLQGKLPVRKQLPSWRKVSWHQRVAGGVPSALDVWLGDCPGVT